VPREARLRTPNQSFSKTITGITSTANDYFYTRPSEEVGSRDRANLEPRKKGGNCAGKGRFASFTAERTKETSERKKRGGGRVRKSDASSNLNA